MNPWLLFTLASAIPGLLHHGNGYDEIQKLLSKFMSPEMLSGDTNKLFSLFQGSPGYTSALHAALGGARVSEGAAARSLGASGLGQSGVGSIANAVGAGLANRAVGDVNTNAFNNAFSGAQDLMHSRLAGLGLPAPKNTPLDTIGALMSSLGSAYFMKGMGGGATNAGGGGTSNGWSSPNPGNNIADIFNILRSR